MLGVTTPLHALETHSMDDMWMTSFTRYAWLPPNNRKPPTSASGRDLSPVHACDCNV